MERVCRRTVLGAFGSSILAGCTTDPFNDTSVDGDDDLMGQDAIVVDRDPDPPGHIAGDEETPASTAGPPLVERHLPMDHSLEAFIDAAVATGVPPDGIPSIDEPRFNEPDNPPTGLHGNSPVFGVRLGYVTKAYPQYILVHHEVVNDVINDEPVVITYCPLTGTAQGFYRGESSFGVSGTLVNSNLVPFDWESKTFWSQILAQGLVGPHAGEYLEEFQVIWTTWDRWRRQHLDTRVLNTATGYARNYGGIPTGVTPHARATTGMTT